MEAIYYCKCLASQTDESDNESDDDESDGNDDDDDDDDDVILRMRRVYIWTQYVEVADTPTNHQTLAMSVNILCTSGDCSKAQ